MTVLDIVVRAENQASQALDAIDSDIDQLSTTAEKTSQKVGKSFTDMGKKMTVRMTLPLLAAGVAAFKLGSDLSESISQVGTVFGEEAGKVITASENINDAFSQADFLGFAGNIGDIAQGLGFAQEEADDVALSVISLGQDLSSFKNIPIEQAVNAITSALTGERESLKTMGIVLKDTDVKQRALELGLWDGVEALSSSAQAQATMSLITEKSANSIGDFERTSSGAANKARILAANVGDLAASFGTKMLPMGEKILSMLNKLVGFFTNLPGPVQNVILVVAGLAAAIGPLLFVTGKLTLMMGPGGSLATGFSTAAKGFSKMSKVFMANPWILLAAAVIAIVILVVKNWDKIVAFLLKAWEIIKTALQAVADFFVMIWDIITEAITTAWTAIADFFVDLWETVTEAIVTAWDAVVDFFVGLWETITGAIHTAWNAVVSFLAGIWRTVTGAIHTAWNGVVSFFSELPGRIIGALSALASTVLAFIIKWHPVAILFRKAKEFWPEVSGWFAGLPGRILDGWKNIGKLLFDVGKKIIQGLWDGLKNTWKKVTGWVSNLGGWITNLKGPATVDAQLLTANGQLIMGGLLGGLQKSWPKVQAFMASRSLDIDSAFSAPNVGLGDGSVVIGRTGSSMGGMGDVATLLREQNGLLRGILAKTGFSIDGRDLADAVGGPLVNEIRARTGT